MYIYLNSISCQGDALGQMLAVLELMANANDQVTKFNSSIDNGTITSGGGNGNGSGNGSGSGRLYDQFIGRVAAKFGRRKGDRLVSLRDIISCLLSDV
jgi:hypothetical protein